MSTKTKVRCGAWASPISPQLAAAGAARLADLFVDQDRVFCLESRPSEKGRTALVELTTDGKKEVLPDTCNIRTQAHEYGGGACAIKHGQILLSDMAHGGRLRLFWEHGRREIPIPSEPGSRYADFDLHPDGSSWCAVKEKPRPHQEPESSIVLLRADDGQEITLCAGSDFYSNPRFSPDGSKLCWLSWTHPDMPWDKSHVWTADFEPDGTLRNTTCVTPLGHSSFQPEWVPKGNDGQLRHQLLCAIDIDGWWRPCLCGTTGVKPLISNEAEYGQPQWVFGMRSLGFTEDGRVAAAKLADGFWSLVLLDMQGGTEETLAEGYASMDALVSSDGYLYFIATRADTPQAVYRLKLSSGQAEMLYTSAQPEENRGQISIPVQVSFPVAEGGNAWAYYYPPANEHCEPLEGEKPPVIVKIHGGPTARSNPELDIKIQFWTSRGFAFLDVNYRGSTGHGRSFREKLYGNWGRADAEDAVAAVRHICGLGWADSGRAIIRGGSAGGYTVLRALQMFSDFKAGACYYAVSDLRSLATDTHKFEAHYLDKLIGSFEEHPGLYDELSPINHAEAISCPVIFFQGNDDKVVPPSQTQSMADALEKKNIPHACHFFDGEGHGFKMQETVAQCLTAELEFYEEIFGFSAGGIKDQPQPD